MSVEHKTRYTCDRCLSTRAITINSSSDNINIFRPKQSSNGLFIYSDIHRCENGILGINNLHIDGNSAVRTIEVLTLPSEKIQKNKIPGLPSPKMEKKEYETVRVTGMNTEAIFRIRILNRDLGINLVIGDVDLNHEYPEHSLDSSQKRITLDYYPSDIPLDDNIEAWMVELINMLEILPPTKIGLFIETLRYIYQMRRIGPAKFHLEMLEMILLSHKIYFDLVNNEPNFEKILVDGKEKYGKEASNLMIKLLSYIEVNPKASLQNYTKTHQQELSHLIYLFLSLEREKMIHIYRPKTDFSN